MSYALGRRSRQELATVHDPMPDVVEYAITITTVNFCVHDGGGRTVEEQAEYVADGTSKTMDSAHLRLDAVDLVPWIGGKLVWDWPGCCEIARAMRTAGIAKGVAIRWLGCPDRILTETTEDPAQLVADYIARRKKRFPGRDVFVDGPHFELVRKAEYP